MLRHADRQVRALAQPEGLRVRRRQSRRCGDRRRASARTGDCGNLPTARRVQAWEADGGVAPARALAAALALALEARVHGASRAEPADRLALAVAGWFGGRGAGARRAR